MSHPTDVSRFMEDLDGGVVAERLGVILSHAAAAATDNPKKKARVSIEMDITNIGSGGRVGIAHKLSFKIPHEHGTQAEDHTTETVMFVNTGGEMTLEPKNQIDMLGHAHRNALKHKQENDQ